MEDAKEKSDLEKEVSMLVHDVPLEVKRKFKEACVRNGKTMKQVLIELMRRYSVRV